MLEAQIGSNLERMLCFLTKIFYLAKSLRFFIPNPLLMILDLPFYQMRINYKTLSRFFSSNFFLFVFEEKKQEKIHIILTSLYKKYIKTHNINLL